MSADKYWQPTEDKTDTKMIKYSTLLIYTIIYLNTYGQSLINRPIPNSNFLEYKKLFKLGYGNDVSTLIIRTMAFDTSEFILNKRITSEFYTFTKDTFTNWNRLRQVEIEERLGLKKPRLVADSITDTLAYFRKRKLEIPKEIASRWKTINNIELPNLIYLHLNITKYTGNLNDFADTNSIPQCDILAKQILDMASKSNVAEIYIYSDHPFNYHFKNFKNLTKVYIEMANGFKIVDTSTLNKYADFIYPKKNKKVNCKDILELTSQNFYLDSLIPIPISFDSSCNQKNYPMEFTLRIDGFKGLPKGIEHLNLKKINLFFVNIDSLPEKLKSEVYGISGQIKYLGNILDRTYGRHLKIVGSNDEYWRINSKLFPIASKIRQSGGYESLGIDPNMYPSALGEYYKQNSKKKCELPCLICTEFYKSNKGNLSERKFYQLMQNKNIQMVDRATSVVSIYEGYRFLPYNFNYEVYLANGNDILLSKDSLLPLEYLNKKNVKAIFLNFIDSTSLSATQGKNLNNISAIKSDELQVYFYNCDVNFIIQNTPIEILEKINYCFFDYYSLAHLNYENAKKLNTIKFIEIPSMLNKKYFNSYQKTLTKKSKTDTKVHRLFTTKKRKELIKEYAQTPLYLNDY